MAAQYLPGIPICISSKTSYPSLMNLWKLSGVPVLKLHDIGKCTLCLYCDVVVGVYNK